MALQSYTLAELAERVGARLVGDADHIVMSVARLDEAGPAQLAFCTGDRNLPNLRNARAGAVLLREPHLSDCPVNALVVPDPYWAYAVLATLLHPRVAESPGVHPSAVVSTGAHLGENVHIAPNVVVGPGAVIEPGCEIGAGSYVGREAIVGEGSILGPGVVLGDRCRLGQRGILHPGVVIGADGFGFAPSGTDWKKVPQLGAVELGDDVEVGANSTIDRGALENTVIGDGVKLDNMVHIAHNVRIGAHTVIAACTAIAGSTTIGEHCSIGGQCAITGHIEICAGVTLLGMTGISNSIREPGVYASALPARPVQIWRRNVARVMNLEELNKRVRALEKQLEKVHGVSH